MKRFGVALITVLSAVSLSLVAPPPAFADSCAGAYPPAGAYKLTATPSVASYPKGTRIRLLLRVTKGTTACANARVALYVKRAGQTSYYNVGIQYTNSNGYTARYAIPGSSLRAYWKFYSAGTFTYSNLCRITIT